MRQTLKTISQTLLATGVILFLLEMGFRWAGQPPGVNRFAERVILQEHLRFKKPKGEFRIFAFGESTMHGAHYAPVSSPVRWLEKYLHDFLPGRNIRVINFARMGRGSDFAYGTLKDTVSYQPDLILVYLGHNVFLSRNRKEDVELRRKAFRHSMRQWQKQSVFFSTCYRWVIQIRMKSHWDKPEDQIGFSTIEEAPIGYGLDRVTPRHSRVYRENIEFFKEGIRSMQKLAEKRGVPILFLRPVSNLKDFAPYDSLHLKALSPAGLSQWQKFYEEGKQKEAQGDFEAAEAAYLQAEKIDDTYADLSFRLGQRDFREGDFQKAKERFEAARDNDAIIFRATRETLEALDELARKENLQLWNTEKILAPHVPGGVLGEPVIEDNVHFSIPGQAWVARGLADEVARRNWIAPRERWQFQRERPYEEMARELGIDSELLFSADLKMVHYFGTHFPNRLRFAHKALALHPRDPRALRHLAWTYWLMGKKTRALRVYQELRKADSQSFDEIFSNLGVLQKEAEDSYGASPLTDNLHGMLKNGFFGRPK